MIIRHLFIVFLGWQKEKPPPQKYRNWLSNVCCHILHNIYDEALPSTDPNSFSWARVRISLYRTSASLYFPCLRKQDAWRRKRSESTFQCLIKWGCWLTMCLLREQEQPGCRFLLRTWLMKNDTAAQSLSCCFPCASPSLVREERSKQKTTGVGTPQAVGNLRADAILLVCKMTKIIALFNL